MTHPRSAYRENDVRGATAIRLVVLLYEQLIQDLGRAMQSIEQGDIEARTDRINHAILVIAHLQSPLDFVKGGKVARDLDHFYNVLRQNLVQIQFLPSQENLRQQITDLLVVREAWIEVEKVTHPVIATPQGNLAANPPGAPSEPLRLDWKG